MDEPGFHSVALDSMPKPDFADVNLVPIPQRLQRVWGDDPAAAVRAIFDVQTVPKPVKALMLAREVFIRALRIDSAASDRHGFRVAEVVNGEAYIRTVQPHLTFHVGVAAQDRLLRLTTAVTLNDWRGRLYFLPVRLLHPPVVRAMMSRAARRASLAC